MTNDFVITSDLPGLLKAHFSFDKYANPINWVLVTTSKARYSTWLVLRAFEANALFNEAQASEHVCLHIYTASIRRSRGHVIDDLMFFNMPTSNHDGISRLNSNLSRELGFFAGRSYIDNHDDYLTILDHIHNENLVRKSRPFNRCFS